MGFKQDKLIMSSFIKFQYSYWQLILMFYSRTSMNQLNNMHEKCLCLVTSDYDSNFKELVESSHELSTHKTCINYLMIEVFTWAISRNNHWHFYSSEKSLPHTQYLFNWSVRFGVDEIAFRASQLWQKVPIVIKDSSSL